MDVVDLPHDRLREASVVVADAFVTDPGWIDVGPDDARRRHAYARRVCHGILKICARAGGPIWQVERAGRSAGVLASLDPGMWPPPYLRSMLAQAPGPLLAGPATLWRSLRGDSALHRGHPTEEHFFVWLLAVQPDHQRSGVGRALLSHALARADDMGVRSYLDTANPDNLPYYRSFGFEPHGRAALPRGAPLWFMHRDVRASTGA